MTIDKHLAIAIGAGAGVGLLVALVARPAASWHLLAGVLLGGGAGAVAYRVGGTAVWRKLEDEVRAEDEQEAAAAAAQMAAQRAVEDEDGEDPDAEV